MLQPSVCQAVSIIEELEWCKRFMFLLKLPLDCARLTTLILCLRRRAGIERESASRADQRVLRWFGHVERMDDYRMARRVLMAEDRG